MHTSAYVGHCDVLSGTHRSVVKGRLRTLNRFLTFSSEAPTYLLRISGPFTTLGSFPFSIFPICRAISVFPAHQASPSQLPRMQIQFLYQ